jgi:cold shock CspA family protein
LDKEGFMPQATVKSYDSLTKTGVLMADDGETTWDIVPESIEGTMFRFLRPGQRVTFDLVDESPRNLRIGIA